MASQSTNIAPDDLTKFISGDESALERIFRAEYEQLESLASTDSEDSSSAPRIVESAFYSAWGKRASFASPGDLASFLREAVHHEALRERGRRASLQRFHGREGAAALHAAQQPAQPVGVDEAWAALLTAIHAPPKDEAHAAEVRHDISRHGTAVHMGKVAAPQRNVRGFFLMIGVAVIVAAFIVGLWRFLGASDPGERVDAILARSEARTVQTSAAQRANVPLSDGSSASLGPESQLRIPKEYGEQMRVVGLQGTATFTVAEAQEPFFVKAGTARIRATGTVLDVSTFDSAGTLVRVREGTVEVTSGDSTRAISVGEALLISADSVISTPTPEMLAESLAWTDGRFVIDNRPMQEVPALLQRWYGLRVSVLDSALLQRRVNIQVPLDSTRQVISALEKEGRAVYATQGQDRVFRDTATTRR